MTKRKIFALLLALCMIIGVFGACAPKDDPADDKTVIDDPVDQKEPEQKEEDNKDEEQDVDAPVEEELLSIKIMSPINRSMVSLTYEEARDAELPTLMQLEEYAHERYGILIEREPVESESYVTVYSGYIAAGTLPDSWEHQSIDANVLYGMIDNGVVASLDDVFAHSDGTAYNIFYNDGPYAFNRGANSQPDGKWYWFNTPNQNHYRMNMDDYIDGDYFVDFGYFTIYPMMIREDWLNDLGMEIPTTVDEFYQALLAMNQQDANGNGAADERAMFGMGTGDQYWGGIPDWFGLHRRWQVDMNSGEVMLPELEPGFVPYTQYCKQLYDSGLSYIAEGGTWLYGTDLAGNYCSAHVMYPTNVQFFTTGDEDSMYLPCPPMQAVEGIKPTYMWQAVEGTNVTIMMNAKADYEACARYLDFIMGPEYTMAFYAGHEGTAWEIIDGEYIRYDLTQEQYDEGYGGAGSWLAGGYGPQVLLTGEYAPDGVYFETIEDAQASGIGYTSWMSGERSYDGWFERESVANPWITSEVPSALQLAYDQILYFGAENILFTACDTNMFASQNTEEETAALAEIPTSDLLTYLDELCVGLMTGQVDPSEYESKIQYAKDSLGLAEYLSIQQAKVDRTLKVMGIK